MNKGREHFVTCGQMKILERRADENGLSYYQMMENAGTHAAEIIMEIYSYTKVIGTESAGSTDLPKAAVADAVKIRRFESSLEEKKEESASKGRVFVFCGKGNNGGDGFVAARAMREKGYEVTVILVDGPPKTDDSITNFGLLDGRGISIIDMNAEDGALMKLKGIPDIVVDAIYGTGFHGHLKGNGLRAAIYINSISDRSVIFALDIPSGLGGDLTDEKEMEVRSAKAHYTIAFHAKKPVHLQKFAEKYCGRIFVADIGIDEESLWNVEI